MSRWESGQVGKWAGEKVSRGFTLVEFVIALTLTVFLAGAVWVVLRTGLSLRERGVATVQISQNARTALDRMSREIRCAILPP